MKIDFKNEWKVSIDLSHFSVRNVWKLIGYFIEHISCRHHPSPDIIYQILLYRDTWMSPLDVSLFPFEKKTEKKGNDIESVLRQLIP